MSLHSAMSARSLAQLAVDIAIALLLVIPATLLHALLGVFPHPALARIILNSSLLHHSLLHHYDTLVDPSATSTALLTQHSPPIQLTARYLAVHTRLLATEELHIPAAAVAVAGQQPQRQRPVHVFLITGNPGSVHFYVRFLSHLYQLSGRTVHIHALSFAGHHHSLDASSPQQTQPLYSLKDQTDMWVAYIREWLEEQEQRLEQHGNEDAQDGQQQQQPHVVLCGHSIGAWIALEVCEQLSQSASHRSSILHSFLLFPTLSAMARTPAGKRLQLPLAFARPLAVLLARLLVTFVPAVLRRLLAHTVLSAQYRHHHRHLSTSRDVELRDTATTVVTLCQPHTVAQCLYLAHTELETVVSERPAHTRLLAEGRATLVSGAADEWDPAWVQEERRRRIGVGRLKEVRMESDVKHAFVVGSSERVAEVVWQQLHSLINPQQAAAFNKDAFEESRSIRQPLRSARDIVV